MAAVDGASGGSRREDLMMVLTLIAMGGGDELPEGLRREAEAMPDAAELAESIRALLAAELHEDDEDDIHETRLHDSVEAMSRGVIIGRAGDAPAGIKEVVEEARRRQESAAEGYVDVADYMYWQRH